MTPLEHLADERRTGTKVERVAGRGGKGGINLSSREKRKRLVPIRSQETERGEKIVFLQE